MNKLVSVNEISELIGCSPYTVYVWAARGYLPSFKIGDLVKFDLTEVEEWLKKQRRQQVNIGGLKSSLQRGSKTDIDRVIKKAIADVKRAGYNPSNGKTDQGLGEEVL